MPRVAIDISHFDALDQGTGQRRYAMDLVCALAGLETALEFTVMGSLEEPIQDIRHVFRLPAWNYVRVRRERAWDRGYLDTARLSSLVRRLGINLYHALHTFVPFPKPCRIVLTEHDVMFELFPEYEDARRDRHYRIYRRLAQGVDRVIAISRTTAEDLIRLRGISVERITVVYHGTEFVNLQMGVQQPPKALQDTLHNRGPWLVTPYNLEPRKNLKTLVEAVSKLRVHHPGLKLALFGRAAATPDREAAFQKLLQNEGLTDDVILLGRVSDGELAWLYRHCTAFVFPSLYEGFGLPVLEAMAQGSCVVARGQSAMAEVVGHAGVLVETADPRLLADGIDSILRDSSRRAKISESARERARQFTTRRMAEQTLEVYRDVLRSDKRLRPVLFSERTRLRTSTSV